MTSDAAPDLSDVASRIAAAGGGPNELRALAEHLRTRGRHLVDHHAPLDRAPLVPMDEWLGDPEMFGGRNLRPEVRRHLVCGWAIEIVTLLLQWGKGGGKSYAMGGAIGRMSYEVLCGLRDGWLYQANGLEPGTVIYIPIMCVSQQKAREVVFEYVRLFCRQASWFTDQYPPRERRDYLDFCDWRGNVMPLRVVPATHQNKGILGEAIYGFALDEMDAFPETLSDDGRLRRADELYNMGLAQMLTRFPRRHGRAVLGTSPTWSGSVSCEMMRRQRESPDPSVYAVNAPAWELDGEDHNADGPAGWREYGMPPVAVPQRYWKLFDSDAEVAKRNIAARPSAALEAYDPHGEQIMGGPATDPEPPPPDGRGPDPSFPNPILGAVDVIEDATDLALTEEQAESAAVPIVALADWFEPQPGAQYALHFDYGVTNNALGGALSHWKIDPDPVDVDDPLRVVIDLAFRVLPQEVGGRIKFSRCRALVYELIRRGFDILTVSTDGFESEDTRQILSGRGIHTALVSCDKTLGPYGDLKSLIHERKLDYGPAWWCNEYRHLELVQGKKVDHPPAGSKDAADSVAGSVHCSAIAGRSAIAAGAGVEREERAGEEKYAKRVNEILNRGAEKLERLRKAGHDV